MQTNEQNSTATRENVQRHLENTNETGAHPPKIVTSQGEGKKMAMPSHQVACDECNKIHQKQHNQFVRSKHHFCSKQCKERNKEFIRYAAEQNGNTKRGRGNGDSYIKYNGRHQHRVVMENKLGRPLKKGEIVHHIDENKSNNSPENLMVMTQSQHIEMHRAKMLHERKIKAGY